MPSLMFRKPTGRPHDEEGINEDGWKKQLLVTVENEVSTTPKQMKTKLKTF